MSTHYRTTTLIARRVRVLYVELIVVLGGATYAVVSDRIPMELTPAAATATTGPTPAVSTIPVPTPGVTAPGDAWAPLDGWAAWAGGHWPWLLVIGALLALTFAAPRIARAHAAASDRLARLADPTRCPDCGRVLAAHDDVVTPHDCPDVQR